MSSIHGPAALLTLAALGGAELHAQSAGVRVEENFRAAPNEAVVGVLLPGTPLVVRGTRGAWIEADLEGWVWIRSLQKVDRDGHDLVVHPENPDASHENLRSRPSGPVLARLERGALLSEQERIPGWIRVRRRGWVWAASVDVDPAPVQAVAEDEPDRTPAGRGPEPSALLRTGGRGLAVLGAPDGDTLARVDPETDLELLERRGGWIRVRLDGWAWLPQSAVDGEGAADAAGLAAGGEMPTPAAVAADPDAWQGRLVTWELRFISLERAESVRTDFFEGEPFLLARGVDDAEDRFVYVALPPDKLAEGERLDPLQRITVVGRVRVGASSLTGSPIVDLVELRPEREAPGG